MMILRCKSIFEPQTSGNWKKQLQRTWSMTTSSKDLLKVKVI